MALFCFPLSYFTMRAIFILRNFVEFYFAYCILEK